jgi:hypothetical protein
MLAMLLELALCLAAGAAAAYFFTSSTSMFVIVMRAVTIGLWFVIRVIRHSTKEDRAVFSFATITDALFFWWP